MVDNSGVDYSASDIEALSQDINKIVAEQRGSVPAWYPADYLYYPLAGKNGNPLITKVGDQYLSAWMKRSETGEDFDTIALLNQDQVRKIYNSRPDAMPDVAGGVTKSSEYTGKQVYVNPELGVDHPQYEISADNVSDVYFNKITGEIVSAAVSFESNANSYDQGEPYKYQRALLPNALVEDGNVSRSDLAQQYEGYRLTDQVVDIYSQDASNKIKADEILIKAISGENIFYNGQAIMVGGAVSYLSAAQGGNYAPDMIINNPDIVYSISGINFEHSVYSNKQNNNEAPLPQPHNSPAPPQVLPDQGKPEENVTPQFNQKSMVIHAPQGSEEKLDKILSRLSGYVENGDRVSRINRAIIPVLKHLKNISESEEFAGQAEKAISALKEMGLAKHADIISGYVQDLSKESYRTAKDEIKQVGTANEQSALHNITPEQAQVPMAAP